MKNTLKRVGAVLIIAAMLLTQLAFAGYMPTGTYDVSFSLTDGSITVSDTLTMQAKSTSMVAALAQLAAANYDSSMSTAVAKNSVAKGAKLFKFKDAAMRAVLDAGLAAYGDQAAWSAFCAANDFDAEPAVKDALANISTTIEDMLATPSFVLTKGAYTLNVSVSENMAYFDDTNTTTTEPDDTEEVGVVEAEGGTVKATDVPAGEEAEIAAEPEEGNRISRVIVTAKNGSKVKLTYVADGEYSYVMPEGGVNIEVVFAVMPADPAVTGVGELLNVNDHVPYMVGDENGDFRPNDNLKRSEAAMMLFRLLRDTTVEINKTFFDVPADSWYAGAVNTLASIGILGGTETGGFEPNRMVTRAEFATMCSRFATDTVEGFVFDDTADHWAVNAISTCVAYGWLTGDENGNFNPNDLITRAEAAAVVNRMLCRYSDPVAVDNEFEPSFDDVSDNLWSWYEIAEATSSAKF